jgi:hypothetical protein
MSDQQAADDLAQFTRSFLQLLHTHFTSNSGTQSHPHDTEAIRRNPLLCSFCGSLTFDKLVSGFQIHESFAFLIISAVNCPLCHVFLSTLFNQPSDNWWPDEKPLGTDVVRAKLVRDATTLNNFPERLELTVLRPEEEIVRVLERDRYAKNPEIRLVKHTIVCIDPSQCYHLIS